MTRELSQDRQGRKRVGELLLSDKAFDAPGGGSRFAPRSFEYLFLAIRLTVGLGMAAFGVVASIRLEKADAFPLSISLLLLGVAIYLAVPIFLLNRRPSGSRTGDERFRDIHIELDVLFAMTMMVIRPNADSAAIVLFLVPLLPAAHFGPARRWVIVTTAVLCIAAASLLFCLLNGGHVGGESLNLRETGDLVNAFLLLAPRLAILGAASLVLRLYRLSDSLGRRWYSDLSEGTECGITLLDFFGHIQDWNRKQATDFAPPDAAEKIARSLPCYSVFQAAKQPCRWCALDWHPVKNEETDATELWEEDGPEKWEVDPQALIDKIEAKENWAVSNQLTAARDALETAEEGAAGGGGPRRATTNRGPPALVSHLFRPGVRRRQESGRYRRIGRRDHWSSARNAVPAGEPARRQSDKRDAAHKRAVGQ